MYRNQCFITGSDNKVEMHRTHWGRCAVCWLLIMAACKPHRVWNNKRSIGMTGPLLVVSPSTTQGFIRTTIIQHTHTHSIISVFSISCMLVCNHKSSEPSSPVYNGWDPGCASEDKTCNCPRLWSNSHWILEAPGSLCSLLAVQILLQNHGD